MTVNFPTGGGATTITEADFTGTSQCHIDITSIISDYYELPAQLQTELVAIDANFTCTYSEANKQYTIANSSQNFDISFSTAAGLTLGYTASGSTNVSTTSSDNRPYYVMEPQHDGRTQYSDTYEPEGVASIGVSDSGNTTIGLARSASPKYIDWRQTFETRAATQKHKGTTAIPWTWEHFFEHVRTIHPFAVKDGYDNAVFNLRAEGSHFRPEIQTPDFDDQWHIPFATILRGRL